MSKYPPHVPIIGDKFGYFEVISDEVFQKGKDTHAHFKVKCKCGHEQLVAARTLKNGKSTKCRSCSLRECKNLGRYLEGPKAFKVNDLTLTVYNGYKRGAKSRGFCWDENLTMEYLSELFIKQNKKCALSGEDICLDYDHVNNRAHVKTASLDRIDSSIGYIIGNVQWVHKRINRLKNNFPQDEFIEICKLIANHANQQPS